MKRLKEGRRKESLKEERRMKRGIWNEGIARRKEANGKFRRRE